MEYLLFRLYGPLVSWGDIAVGESRHSHIAPTKSAVMGLVAAALGIRREQEELHQALNHHYALAAAVWDPRQLLRDYHTVQAADSVGKFQYRTRRDELTVGRDRLGSMQTYREYRTDALAWIALSADKQAPFSLQQLATALVAPKFVLYLGRKSCPLAAPLAPALIQAEGFYQAFNHYTPGPLCLADTHRVQEQGNGQRDSASLPTGEGVDYFWEGELQAFAPPAQCDAMSLMTLTQHDRLLSRQRWQFAPRHVQHLHLREGH